MNRRTLSWQLIETALINILREWDFEFTNDRGDTFINVQGDEICIGDFAKDLAKELGL